MNLDLGALDRDIARAARALRETRGHSNDVPSVFRDKRHVASRATIKELLRTEPSLLDRPLRDAIVAWIARFVVERVTEDRAAALRERLREPALRIEDGPKSSMVTTEEAWKIALARPAAARGSLVSEIAERARTLDGELRDYFALRLEVRRAIGEPSIDEASEEFEGAAAAFAREFVSGTEELAKSLVRRRAREADGELSPLLASFDLALATEATEGWPQSLSSRWVRGHFPDARTGDPPFPVPLALSGASYLRAFEKLGEELVRRASPRPFAPLVSPNELEESILGAALAELLTSEVFLRRGLGLFGEALARQARALERAFFFESRRRALRVLARAGGDLGDTVEGERGELGPILRASHPFGVEATSRVVALAYASSLGARLRDRFDEDWFKNPRIVPFLREPLSTSVLDRPIPDPTSLESEAKRLAATYEKRLA